MPPDEWQELLADPDNWPDHIARNWPAELRLSYWATKEIHVDSIRLFGEVDDKGLNELFHDVLGQLGYQLTRTSSGQTEISLSSREEMHAVRRIARFVLEADNTGKSSQLISSELRELGCQARQG